MRKLKLNKVEKEILNCYMQGASMLSLNSSTIWRRRKSMQNKYLANIENIKRLL